MTRIVFRTDASLTIGSGHVMRCLSLGAALRRRGASVSFICRAHQGNLCDLIEQQGFSVARLAAPTADFQACGGPAHAAWLGVAWDCDAQQTRAALEFRPDWLVIDHYAIERRWQQALRAEVGRIMVIDDLADREHDCELLVDQNFYTDADTRYEGKVGQGCQLLLGPRYALLRDEFTRLHLLAKARTLPVQNILVFFGGVDADNYTARAIAALAKFKPHVWQVAVVIGAQHPCRAEITSMCAEHGYACHVQTSQMATLMAASDLAIGAAGSAGWERCCLGLPCIVGAVARNQIQAARDLAGTGAVKFVGVTQEITIEKLRHEINLAQHGDWLNHASKRGLELVDAEGANRIILSMENV